MRSLQVWVNSVLLLLLCGCVLTPSEEDRRRFDDLTLQLRQMNVKLEEYKDRIDRLNRALEALTKIQSR